MSDSAIFNAAVKLPADQRTAYLDQACGNDQSLRQDVESLLRAHEGQGLPLRLEAGNDFAAVHARLDDLQRYFSANRMKLFRDKDQAEASLANLFHEAIGADARPGSFGDRLVSGGFGGRPAPGR